MKRVSLIVLLTVSPAELEPDRIYLFLSLTAFPVLGRHMLINNRRVQKRPQALLEGIVRTPGEMHPNVTPG
jgi:hypothetical protein